jgi:hypothetical protein
MGTEAVRFLVLWMAGWAHSRQLEVERHPRDGLPDFALTNLAGGANTSAWRSRAASGAASRPSSLRTSSAASADAMPP